MTHFLGETVVAAVVRTFLLLLCERCVTMVVKPLTAAVTGGGGKGVAVVPRT